ncbi:hypothetical protein TRIP_B10050 [uncultured Desulfatiglans sp.]|uniref:Uncharacterized protein n=1 Tax=Uncultured Desulfatiglans sp. TaxID=1748965 RepID=A0A653A108_UNCDX|nr:hypothetical protein TRIP_B10050 [uncultured Desulfatiglans sp.]
MIHFLLMKKCDLIKVLDVHKLDSVSVVFAALRAGGHGPCNPVRRAGKTLIPIPVVVPISRRNAWITDSAH